MPQAAIGKILNNNTIIISEGTWAKIHRNLAQNYPASVILIREKMRSVLGFTVRRHREWIKDQEFNYSDPIDSIHLDFYDQPKKTMFLLKYSEFLDKTDIDI